MNKTKFLSLAVIVLVILNVFILFFMFFSKENHSRHKKMPNEIIIEQLNFDKKQITEYDKLIQNHRKTIRELDGSIRNTKGELYFLLSSDSISSTQKDSLVLQLATFQKEIEVTHFNHFLAIKKICKKEQLADYKNLTNEFCRLFESNKNPRHD